LSVYWKVRAGLSDTDSMINDGRFIIDVSPDAMRVRGTFTPAGADGRPLTMDDIDYELRGAGIVEGVNLEVVQRSLELCNRELHPVRDVVIARGQGTRPEMPEVLVFPPKIQSLDTVFLPPEQQLALQTAAPDTMPVPEKEHSSSPGVPGLKGDAGKVDEHGNIDFRETHGVFIIHEGQILAVQRERIQGIPGRNVRGEYVPFEVLKVPCLEIGKNAAKNEDGRIVATKNGRLVWNSKSFWVDETLELAVDVGYKTGNIRFPGNLVLKASIKDRFKIWVGGNLDANGPVDAFEIFCGGNMTAKVGIIGKGRGLVRVHGTLMTRFIEHCTIEAIGPILVEQSSFNARLFSAHEIKTSEKGRIVGGETCAFTGVHCNNIGNKAGTPTVVQLGWNYVVIRKMEFGKQKLAEYAEAIHQFDSKMELYQTMHPGEALDESFASHRATLLADMEKARKLMEEAANELENKEDAQLVVSGTCFPGVVVQICGAYLEVTAELKNVRFMLKMPQGKVVSESLSGSA